jgi:acyl carrier protein
MNSAIDIKIRQLIKDKLGKDESQITDEASFRDDLEVDSLDFVELVVSIEKEFKISVSDEMYERLKTVGALNSHIAKLVDPFGLEAIKAVEPAKKAEPVRAEEPELEVQEAL